MKFLLKWLLPLFIIIAFLLFSPDLTGLYWYYKISYFEVQIETIAKKGGMLSQSVAKKLLSSSDNVNIDKGLELSRLIASNDLITYIIPFITNTNRDTSDKAIRALLAVISEDAIMPLSKIAETASPRVRLGILQTLGKIEKSDKLIDAIIKFKDDPEWVIRMTLADILLNFSDTKTVNVLKKLLSDDYFEVAYSAAVSLGSIGENNPFLDIFDRLKPESSWIDKQKAIRLLSYYPKKIVSYLVARYVSSEFKFLAVSSLEWMSLKGDERDFSLIVKETNKRDDIVKVTALKTLSKLANKVNKRDDILLTLMRFLKSNREDISASCIEGIKILNGKIAANQVIPFISHEDLDLAYEAILTLGSFAEEKYTSIIIENILSPHSKKRSAAYLASIYYDNLSVNGILDQIKLCGSVEEADGLGLFLHFHVNNNDAYNILMNQYRNARDINIKIKLLEMLAISNDNITTLDLLKIMEKSDLKTWERVKNIIDVSFLDVSVPAIIDGFNYFKRRQPKGTKFSVISFSSASKSFWDNKDILYLKSSEESMGKIEGTILYDDYNSYYYANNENEVLQISKDLVKDVTFSPLYELGKLYDMLNIFQLYLNKAFKKGDYRLAAYFIHKSTIRIQILKSELLHQNTAIEAILNLENIWKNNLKLFEEFIQTNNLVNVAGKYIAVKEAIASEIEKLDKEEAEKRKKSSEDKYLTGMELFEKEEYEHAISTFKEALDIWPFNSNALKQIGVTYAQTGEYEKALSFYNQLYKKRPNDVDILNNLSLIHRIKGDNATALKMLTLEIEANPSLIRGRVDASEVLIELNRIDDAIQLLESGVKISEKPFDLHLKLSKLYRQAKDYESSLHQIEECLKLEPENIESLTYAGLLQFSLGNTQEAIAKLKRAITFDISNIPARLTYAEILISLGDIKNAEIELNKVLVIDSSNNEAKDLLISIKTKYNKN